MINNIMNDSDNEKQLQKYVIAVLLFLYDNIAILLASLMLTQAHLVAATAKPQP